MAKASFDIRLEGFPAANRDAVIELVNQATGQKVERKPFLDGSLLVRDLDPGTWELSVRHPNLVNAIDRRLVRLFPQPMPTRVPVLVRPDLFRDTPIRDIPDADLGPIQQTAATVVRTLDPIGGKSPGEVIRAEDWNVLVGAVADIARSLGELTRLVAPQGHDHPEIAEKIAEVQGNIQRFTESFGRSLLELRRELESENLRKRLDLVLDRAGASTAVRERIGSRIGDLEVSAQAPTPAWANRMASHGNALTREILELANEQGEPDEFLALPEVSGTLQLLEGFAAAGGQTKAEQELALYRQTAARTGTPLRTVLGG
ncbi:MAG: hypothetical protein MUF35_00855 [Candidatus Nanopelagicales bacterium]|jgi:hypothetical protein|nr:hypothetical protein [Candidatus Nanopelagicales bacterium]